MSSETTRSKSPAANVLIVDDETGPRQELALLLASAGFDVRQAADAQETEEQLTSGRIGIVVVDADMPNVSGYQLCSRIRQAHGSDLYLILRTTKDELFSRELNVDDGADDFLIEPLTDKEILARVETGRKMKELQQKLIETSKSLALLETTDPLTGACNKKQTESEIRREMERSRRYGAPVSLVLLDIDGFRLLNDKLGRAAGDRTLEELARILKLSTRTTDVVGRYGGEEFALVLPETSIDRAIGAAEKIRRAIEQTAIAVGDKTVQVTVSCGVVTFENNNFASMEDLVAAAKETVAQAKTNGRNRCEVYA
ncbi:MAG: diguanylate cyclase [Planctomycetota bacterium]